MMFIYEITEVNFLMSLRKYHDVTIAKNDAATNMLCLESHKKPYFDSYSPQNFTN